MTDPRNLAAIIRSAAFFNIKAVWVKKRNQSLLTQSAIDTAQGGFAWTKLVVGPNLRQMIEDAKQKEFWVLGADLEGSEALGENLSKYEKKVLVMGSEQTGISRLVRESCDVLLKINRPGKLDSLNVSVAAGILCFAAQRVH